MITNLLKKSPAVTALRQFVVDSPLYRAEHAIHHDMGLSEPLFYNPIIDLDPHQFGTNYKQCWRKIASAGFTHVRHLLHRPLPELVTAWRQRLPRIHHSVQKLQALRSAVLTFALPDFLLPNHISATHTWLQSWKVTESSSHYVDRVTTKELYLQLTARSFVSSPRVVRQWSHLHLPPAILHMRPAWFKPVWRMHLPRKWLDMLYSVLNNALPTKVKITRQSTADSCPHCHAGPDDIPHILFECPVAADLWRWAQLIYVFWIPHSRMPTQALDFKTWLCITLESSHLPHRWQWLFWCIPVLRALWFCRNDQVFNNTSWTAHQLQQHCIQDWLSAAMVLVSHYPPAEFHPLISFHFATHTVQWRHVAPAAAAAAPNAVPIVGN